MCKRTTRILTLCLFLLFFSGIAKSEDTVPMVTADPVIVYDGTVLNVFVEFTPTAEKTALVELIQLGEGMIDNKEAQEALAKGWKLMGVDCDLGVFSGDTMFTTRVYSERYDGISYIKGFHYMLAPSFPRENLTLTMVVELRETHDGPALTSFQVEQAIPDAISAQAAFIPADMRIGEAHVDKVFVSGSEEALCVLLHFDSYVEFVLPDSGFARELPYNAYFADLAANQKQATMELYSLPTYQPAESDPWWIFVFDPLQEMPDQMLLTLQDMAGIEETVSFRIDLSEQNITVF